MVVVKPTRECTSIFIISVLFSLIRQTPYFPAFLPNLNLKKVHRTLP